MREYGDSIVEDLDDDPRAVVSGRITDLEGKGIADAVLEVWQNASNRALRGAGPQPDANESARAIPHRGGRQLPTADDPSGPVPDFRRRSGGPHACCGRSTPMTAGAYPFQGVRPGLPHPRHACLRLC
jgi:protocatechuate 3,4-dioxygenase beta subunit